MNHRKTKIVCTMGPATDDAVTLKKLVAAGMDVARVNMSHGTHDEQTARIARLKTVREELNVPLPILLDTKGPEVRVKTFKGGRAELNVGDKFIFVTADDNAVSNNAVNNNIANNNIGNNAVNTNVNTKNAYVEGDNTRVAITFPALHKYVKTGDTILADDGNMAFRVDDVSPKEITTTVTVGGVLSNRKSLNFPGIEIDMEYMSDADKKDIAFGVEHGVDFIALSFVRSRADVEDARKFLKSLNNGANAALISKIENRQGVDNMDDIIAASDGIMVARGDMGVEIPFEELPGIQKQLIKNCYAAGKTVITATQMLESMITSPRPTRAEISDVANAVYDGTSATMLSGETAMGKYPAETVATMAKIIRQAETGIDYKKRFCALDVNVDSVDCAISHSAASAAHNLNAKAIITITFTGSISRKISRFKPAMPIIAVAASERAYRQLAMSWGVIPVLSEEKNDIDELIAHAVGCAVKTGAVKKGGIVVIAAGVPVGVSGNTNMIKIQKV